MYHYISKEGLFNLKDYKYNSKDRSLVANYIMQPFWNRIIKYFPLWLAPNLITLLGFLAILLSYAITSYYSPTLTEELPRWVYFFNAICLFYYQTMDAIDGKQARRTYSSSALGELFDHGCDAMSTVFTALTTAAALRVGSGYLTYINVVSLMITFYMSQWDVYFNHVLDLWYINVTEAQLFGMLIQIIPGIVGTGFWLTPLTIGYSLPLCQWALIPSALTCVGFSVSAIINVGTHAVKNNANVRMRSVIYTFPCTYTLVMFALWVYLSPHLVYQHIHISCLCVGFLYCNYVGRFVTARVCNLPYDIFYLNMLPLPFAIANIVIFNRTLFDEVLFLKLYTLYSVISYIHFCLCLIDLMTNHLNIRCFKIPFPPVDPNANKKN